MSDANHKPWYSINVCMCVLCMCVFLSCDKILTVLNSSSSKQSPRVEFILDQARLPKLSKPPVRRGCQNRTLAAQSAGYAKQRHLRHFRAVSVAVSPLFAAAGLQTFAHVHRLGQSGQSREQTYAAARCGKRRRGAASGGAWAANKAGGLREVWRRQPPAGRRQRFRLTSVHSPSRRSLQHGRYRRPGKMAEVRY